jgi:hypothetical protein
VVGSTIGSRAEVPGERKPVKGVDEDNDSKFKGVPVTKCHPMEMYRRRREKTSDILNLDNR